MKVFEQFEEVVDQEIADQGKDNINETSIIDQRRKTLTRRKSRKPEFNLLNIQTKINLATK